MAGEIATAYIALVPSMRGFGEAAARQMAPGARAAGARAGQQAGMAFTTAASKESAGWFAQTARGALKNVALYGSMYAAIQGVSTGIRSALDSMVGFNAEIEQATVGFETLLGSSSAAQAEMQWIKDFAKETPFNYKDLVGYSQQLLALGFNAEQAQGVLQATGDAAAALGRGPESIARINLALGQMWTKGKVQSQEMMQLTEAGIGAWQILADAYGTTVANVQEAVTAGQVKASEAVPALVAGMNQQFGGLMAKQSQTFTGIVSNIQDTLQQELASAGEPLFAELKTQAQGFLEALDDPEVIDLMHDLGGYLADGVKVLAEAGKLAWQFRDAIVAVGIAYAASKLLMRVPTGSALSAGTWFSATRAQEAYAAGLRRTTALQAGLTERGAGMLRGVGQVAGLAGVVDGYRRVSEAGDDAAQTAWGFAESIGAGTIAGAAFGGPIGAAVGFVGGLTTSLWSYSQAAQAANKDTTAAQQAIQNLGVDANLASLALSGVTNKQLDAAGGFSSILDAMKSGTYEEYVANLEKQADSLRDKAAEAQAEIRAMGLQVGWDAVPQKFQDAIDKSAELDAALANLKANGDAFSDSQAQITASAYQSAFAMDMQTGGLGAMTQAAWDAVVAQGGLDSAALGATVRMEGLAGVAGYATQMLTGIPTGTKINFTTNASDIMQQILGLIAAREAAANPDNPNLIAAMAGRKKELENQLKKTLTSTPTTLSLPNIPKAPTGGAGRSVANAAKAAADDAARKLEADRSAQRAFGKAFTSLMQTAFEGDFDRYREMLADEIQSLTDQGYKKAAQALKQQSVALNRVSLDYAALTAKLDKAQEAYDDLTQSMRDQYTASRDLILGLGKASDAQSYDQLLYLMTETTNATTEYQGVLTHLKDSGLSKDVWNQLAQAGPESMGLAQSILESGQAGIDRLNEASDGLVSAADSMGNTVADAMYKQGLDAMNAYIDGLKSGQAALDAQLETIANSVQKKVAGAIAPGNAGYTTVNSGAQQVMNTYNLTIDASDLDGLDRVKALIAELEQQPTAQLVYSAGAVVS